MISKSVKLLGAGLLAGVLAFAAAPGVDNQAVAQGQGSGSVGAGGQGTSTGPGGRARTGGGEQNQTRRHGWDGTAESTLFSSSIDDISGADWSMAGEDDCADVAEWATLGERFSPRNMGRLVRVHDALVGPEDPKLAYKTIFLLASFQAELLVPTPNYESAGDLIALAIGGPVDAGEIAAAASTLCASVDEESASLISAASAS